MKPVRAYAFPIKTHTVMYIKPVRAYVFPIKTHMAMYMKPVRAYVFRIKLHIGSCIYLRCKLPDWPRDCPWLAGCVFCNAIYNSRTCVLCVRHYSYQMERTAYKEEKAAHVRTRVIRTVT